MVLMVLIARLFMNEEWKKKKILLFRLTFKGRRKHLIRRDFCDSLFHSLSQTITHKHSLFLYPGRVMMTNGSNGVNSAFVYE